MRRVVIIGLAIVAIGALTLLVVFPSFKGAPAGAQCPPTFPEFAVTPKDGMVSISGRVLYANGAPFSGGPVAINVTFFLPGCGALPLEVATEGTGRFSGNSPHKEPICIRQGGTATASTKAGCEIEGMTQGHW